MTIAEARTALEIMWVLVPVVFIYWVWRED